MKTCRTPVVVILRLHAVFQLETLNIILIDFRLVPSNKLTRFSSYLRKIKIRILFELKFGFLHAYELAMPVVLIHSLLLAKLKLESTRNKSSPGKIRISVRNLSRKVSYFNAGVQSELCKCCKMHKLRRIIVYAEVCS